MRPYVEYSQPGDADVMGVCNRRECRAVKQFIRDGQRTLLLRQMARDFTVGNQEEEMLTQQTTGEAEIRQRIEAYVAAIRDKNLQNVVSIFAPDLVSFDLEPPLQHMGVEAKRQNWARAFAAYEHPIGYEIPDLVLTVGDDLAFGHSLNRMSGTLKGGGKTDYWVRWTSCYRKIGGVWFIVHDQVSVPIEIDSGKAPLNLTP